MGLFDIFKKSNGSNIVISTEPEKDPTQARIEALENEKRICEEVTRKLKADRPAAKYDFEIRHRSEEYTTLAYRNSDIIRVKWTEAAKWIMLQIRGDMAQKYAEDPLFSEQENKKVLMWKVRSNGGDLVDRLYPYILESFDDIEAWKPGAVLTDQEKEYIQAAADLIADITGDSGNTYYDKLTKEIHVLYKGTTQVRIVYKPYKKKPWQLYMGFEDGFKEISDPAEVNQIREKLEADYKQFKDHEETYLRNVDVSYLLKWE